MAINLLVVDALNLIRRVYAAQPGEDRPERASSSLTASVQSLERALRECRPSHAACVFEGQGRSWRHQLYADYKAGHSPMPEALRQQLPAFKEEFDKHGVSSFDLPTLEADDVIATLATKVGLRGGGTVILSTDKVFLQLLSANVRVRDHFGRRELDRAFVVNKFGVPPEQLVDLLALAGDSTNNIPGVPGIGPKTAAKLVTEFGTLEKILSAAPTIAGKVGERLRAHAEEARLSWSLVRLRVDLELGLNLRSLRYGG
ncbi:MAG: flap endonuclease Xni [Acidobacteriota bacterium]